MKHHRYMAMTLLATSNWPSDWGWKAEIICSLVPVALNSACQNAEVNTGSRSEMIEVGIVRLRLFLFSLLGKAKTWFYSNKEAFTTWEACSNAFLAMYFPVGKTNALRNRITGI